MEAKEKIIKIGFDLDGVIIGKPPLISKRLIEWLYRGRINKTLVYRYPQKIEKYIRGLSHYCLFRPPIKRNIKVLKRLSKNKNVQVYAITGRYGFLKDRTDVWLKKNEVENIFKEVYLNETDEQPHRFKRDILNNLKLDYFVDDDPLIINYLKREIKSTKILDEKRAQSKLSKLLRVKILIGISYYHPNISGLTIYAQNLAEELVKRGNSVGILTSRHLNNLPPKEVKKGVLIKRIWTPFIFGRGPIMPTFLLDSYKAVNEVDVVNIHIPQFEGVILALWAKLLGKKIILTHHCDLSNWPGFINQITEKVTYLSHFITCNLAEKVVVNSKDYANNSKFLSEFKNKLEYIYPPIKLKKADFSFNKDWRGIKYKIGFVGRLAREKGAKYLLQAIPSLEKKLGEDFRIFIVGPSKEVVGGGAEKGIVKLMDKFKERLVFLGKISDKQLAGFYKSIDVLVLPSTQSLESFGMVQVEAMLSGRPVVASNLPGVRVPVKVTGMGEIIIPRDVESLAKGIIKVLRGGRKYVKSRKKIEKIFNYKETIDTYEELFS